MVVLVVDKIMVQMVQIPYLTQSQPLVEVKVQVQHLELQVVTVVLEEEEQVTLALNIMQEQVHRVLVEV